MIPSFTTRSQAQIPYNCTICTVSSSDSTTRSRLPVSPTSLSGIHWSNFSLYPSHLTYVFFYPLTVFLSRIMIENLPKPLHSVKYDVFESLDQFPANKSIQYCHVTSKLLITFVKCPEAASKALFVMVPSLFNVRSCVKCRKTPTFVVPWTQSLIFNDCRFAKCRQASLTATAHLQRTQNVERHHAWSFLDCNNSYPNLAISHHP